MKIKYWITELLNYWILHNTIGYSHNNNNNNNDNDNDNDKKQQIR